MLKILLTGITGFIGSQIAEKLVSEGVDVIGLKRPGSDTWRCDGFRDKIDWVDIVDGYKHTVILKKPSIIIHCAWIGVSAEDRTNWILQSKNIEFLVELLDISQEVSLRKFLFLGSQAEYGYIDKKVSEDHVPVATNAYGSIKLACLEILKTFAIQYDINWIWLRIFSVFGEKENQNWLIPSIIDKMKHGYMMDFTQGEQKYAYLYVKDLSNIINSIINQNINSGIYNVSSETVSSLRSLIEAIRDIVNPTFKLNFGVIPYRPNQSMHIEGDMTKIVEQIGEIEFTDFNVALNNTLDYYLHKKHFT